MTKLSTPGRAFCLSTLFAFVTLGAQAQGKQNYSDISDALQSAGKLRGQPGPQSVNWIEGGEKYSFLVNNEIHSLEPKTGKEEVVFDNKGLNFPGGTTPFKYESFQWSHDSRHLVFKTNFRRIYRRSGIAD